MNDPQGLTYETLCALAFLFGMACFYLGRLYERFSVKRYSDAAQRIKDKYRAARGVSERV